jgi:hypothetical protein
MRSAAAWLASATPETVDEFLSGLGDGALMSLPWLFEFWALPHQLPPEGVWKTWVIMGGRGAGKTRAGAEWVRSEVEGARPLDPGRSKRVALVGETLEQVEKVMVFGDSGIMAFAARPEAEVGGDEAPAGLAERGDCRGLFGLQPRGAARPAVRRSLGR